MKWYLKVNRQTHRKTDRQTDRPTDPQTDRQTDRQTHTHMYNEFKKASAKRADTFKIMNKGDANSLSACSYYTGLFLFLFRISALLRMFVGNCLALLVYKE